MTAVAKLPTVDELAQEIRRVDGNHSLGAGALAEALMPFLATLSPAELGGVVTFDVVREVVKARTRLGFASPEGQEEQAARAIELIRELCEEVIALTTRPTPEARDAARWRFVRDNPGIKIVEAGGFYRAENDHGIYATGEWHDTKDAAIDAALALPAQGEGR